MLRSWAEAQTWVRVSAAAPRLSGIGFLVILASGFYLGARIGVLGNVWMRATYAALVLTALVGGPVAGRRMRALRRAAEDTGDRALPALRTAASDALLRVSLRARVAFALSIVYLMIAKPDTGESLLALGVAAVVAIAASVPRRQAASELAQEYR